ncbi:MAG: SRPBCC family protein [Chitinophagaceae bacterium]
MPVHSLHAVQKLALPLEKAWDFFSRPANLKEVTPSHLGFQIRSLYHGDTMYAGQIIEYTVKPILGIPLYWMTEITHVEHLKYFVDEQRYGPYGMWHHQHHFREIEGGVEMTDIVHYKNPFGFIGNIANGLFVQSQLKTIFSYRFQKTESLFGAWPGQKDSTLVFH